MEPVKKKVGLFTFGLTLILIGIVYLQNQYTNLRLFKDLYLLWPIFLILLGLEFIVTKIIYDRKQEEVRLSPSIASIFLVIVILGVTAIWQHIPNLKDLPSLFSREDYYKYSIEEAFDSGPIKLENVKSVTINNTLGRINVAGTSDDSLSVKADIKVRSNDETKAKEYAKDAIKITEGDQVIVENKGMYDEGHVLGSVTIDYTILVPKNVNVKVNNNFGDVEVSRMDGDVSINNKSGATRAADIHGNVTADNGFGILVMQRISGKVEGSNKSGEIHASDIEDTLRLNGSFGNVKVRNAQGGVYVDTKSGQIEVDDVVGDCEISSAFGQINAANIQGKMTARNKNGNIDLSNIGQDIDAETSFGSITWKTAILENASLDIRTRMGSIHGDEFSLPVEKETTSSKVSHVIGTGERKVQLKTENGSVTIKK